MHALLSSDPLTLLRVFVREVFYTRSRFRRECVTLLRGATSSKSFAARPTLFGTSRHRSNSISVHWESSNLFLSIYIKQWYIVEARITFGSDEHDIYADSVFMQELVCHGMPEFAARMWMCIDRVTNKTDKIWSQRIIVMSTSRFQMTLLGGSRTVFVIHESVHEHIAHHVSID